MHSPPRSADRAPSDARVLSLETTRAQGRPGAQCTRSPVRAKGSEYAHEYLQREHRNHPAFPAQWLERLLRALPGKPGFLAPVIRRLLKRPAELVKRPGEFDTSVGGSGPHGLTVRENIVRPRRGGWISPQPCRANWRQIRDPPSLPTKRGGGLGFAPIRLRADTQTFNATAISAPAVTLSAALPESARSRRRGRRGRGAGRATPWRWRPMVRGRWPGRLFCSRHRQRPR
jgi:hypothetical protein